MLVPQNIFKYLSYGLLEDNQFSNTCIMRYLQTPMLLRNITIDPILFAIFDLQIS